MTLRHEGEDWNAPLVPVAVLPLVDRWTSGLMREHNNLGWGGVSSLCPLSVRLGSGPQHGLLM